MKYIKTYRMNLRRTYARIIIKGDSGNEVVYDFTNGNPAGSIPAKCVLHGEYEQNLLEASDFVKNKIISLEKSVPVYEDSDFAEEKQPEGNASTEAEYNIEDEVTTVTEAINYVAGKWGEVAKTAKQAKEIANSYGVDFPNLKVGKR